jgi:hypothetical protein
MKEIRNGPMAATTRIQTRDSGPSMLDTRLLEVLTGLMRGQRSRSGHHASSLPFFSSRLGRVEAR